MDGIGEGETPRKYAVALGFPRSSQLEYIYIFVFPVTLV